MTTTTPAAGGRRTPFPGGGADVASYSAGSLSTVTHARVVAAEWIRLRTLRSAKYLLAAVVLVIIGLAAVAAVGSATGAVPDPDDGGSDRLGGALVGISSVELLVAALGVLVVSSEYASGAIASTFAAVPRRVPVILAKAAVTAGTVFAVSLVAVLSAFALSSAVLAGDGGSPSIGAPGVSRALFGAAAYLAVLTSWGVAFGWLLRSTAGAMGAMFALLYLLPALGLLLPRDVSEHVVPLLPSNAGAAVMQLDGTSFPAPWIGLALFALYAAVALMAAVARVLRRDV